MYKSKLQELCHKKRWALPIYSCMKDGPDHMPQFKASVVVCGMNFNTPAICKSSKEAYNEAAKLAFFHFTSGDNSFHGVDNDKTPKMYLTNSASEATDFQEQFKSKLQLFAKRNNLELPLYSSKAVGLLHAPCFKATVTVGGRSYESPNSYKRIEEAEDVAAQIALLSLTMAAFHGNNVKSYKNLLQEFAQSQGYLLPMYKTSKSGEPQNAIYFSTVVMEGQIFTGDFSRSKKQAEINAAKAAYTALVEGRYWQTSETLPYSVNGEVSELASDLNSMNIADQKKYHVVGCALASPSTTCEVPTQNPEDGKEEICLATKSLDVQRITQKSVASSASVQADNLAQLPVGSFGTVANDDQKPSATVSSSLERTCYLLCNRFRVYPYSPDFDLPKGTVVLPIAEDRWTITSLEFSEENHI